jgi:hypothetical protein
VNLLIYTFVNNFVFVHLSGPNILFSASFGNTFPPFLLLNNLFSDRALFPNEADTVCYDGAILFHIPCRFFL